MGQPAYTHGYIHFKDDTTAARGFTVLHNWTHDAMNGKLQDEDLNGSYNITALSRDGSSLEFHADSGRISNLEWQMENFLAVAKKLEGCMNFDASIMTESSSVYWDISDDEDMDDINERTRN